MTKVFINDDFHVQNIGLMVEECESSLRNEVEEIYVRKSKEVSTFRYILYYRLLILLDLAL